MLYLHCKYNEIGFVWDEIKNRLNKRKHDVSFEEAKTVFYDEHAIEAYDPEHSESEDRFLMLGVSDRLRVLVVSHRFQEEESLIRIISARKATEKEAVFYEEGRR